MKNRHSHLFILLLILTFLTCACDSSPKKDESPAIAEQTEAAQPVTVTVEVTGGTIDGVEQDGILIYKGIPFAAPPVGDLRWKAPAPVQPWEGVKKTDAYCDACMQAENAMGNTAPVSEDCLYLNVWTPAKMTDEKIPVIYWVHGGGYSGGSTSTPMYDGAGFAERGVVMVSVAYRLGPFGFLAHPELSRESGKGSGAYGLLDMIEGLKWVRDNISRFGGDPSNVTIFGHSAGGAAISLLAATPLTKGLFHRAICMSGGSFTPLQISQEGMGLSIPSLSFAEQNGEEFFKKMGAGDINEARALSAGDVQKALTGAMGGIRFRPAADGYVISNDLYSLHQEGNFNYTPILLGHTSDEVGAFGGNMKITADQFVKQIKAQYGSGADIILKTYPHSTAEEATGSSRDLRNDSSFSWNTWTWSRLQSRNGKNKAYQYYFDYHPDSPDGGSGHGSDVPYAFRTLGGPAAAGEDELKLSDMINSYWINFARSGDPNGPGLPEWTAFEEDNQKVMVFDADPGSRPIPNPERMKAIDTYFELLREERKKQ